MSGNGTTGFDRDDERDLRDPALRRALDHAPDSDATPDPRTRDAILKMAHNLAATVPAAKNAAANSASAAPWWRRVFGGGGKPRSRMPWNAAFATVLLATFVTVLWHREPVPDAQLDGEARVAGAAAPAAAPPAPAPAQPAAEAAPPAEAPLAAAPAPRPASPPSAAAKKAPAAEQKQAQAQRDAGADAVRRPAPPLQAAPAPVAPAPASPSAAVAEQAAPSRSDEQREERLENERRRAYAAEAPAPAAAPAPAIAPPPPPQGDNASADASGALQRAPAPRAAVPKSVLRAEGPAGFTALDRWTSFSFTGSGAEVRHARGDIEGLPALLGTVARSATAPDEALAAPVEARLSLYRGSTLVAVLEIAGGQVRWTPQPGGIALVGTPPAQALDALRALLTR